MRSVVFRLLVCLLLFAAGSLRALSQVQPADASFYADYPFIRIIGTNGDTPSFSDDEFFSSAAKVVFPAGKTALPQDSEFLRVLEQTVLPRLNRDSMQLLKVVMRGAASPEGSFELNCRLGEQRARALLTFLTDRVQFPVADDVLLMGNDVEDYRSLCLLMRNAADADYGLVQSLCDEHLARSGPAVLKQMLQEAKDGQLWKRLLSQYFPQLRTARLMLCFRKYVPETVDIEVLKPVVVAKADTVVIEQKSDIVIQPAPVAAGTVQEEAPAVMPRREMLSLKTNLLFYAAYIPGYGRWCPIPNIAVEYYPRSGHFTYGFSFDMPWWQHYNAHKYFQLRNYQLETRYYLRPSGAAAPGGPAAAPAPAFSGFYLSVYAHLGVFGICFDADRGWVGEGAGGGIGVGYVTPISRNGHWRLELALQAGFFRCKYDPYRYENPIDPDYKDNLYYYKWTLSPDLFKKRQYRWNWIGPTRIGITLSYDLLYRKRLKIED